MLAPNVIPVPPTIFPTNCSESGLLRVAAYCRVSTAFQKDGSLKQQLNVFRREIRRNKSWQYSGVFWDIKSGRSKNRPGLQKLIKKCEQGSIDMVIMKSLSRFTRNTVDALQIIRHLTSLNIDFYFQKENIHTKNQHGELVLSIHAALAEFEGYSISENVKWGIENSVKTNPNSKIYARPCYGYYRSKDGTELLVSPDADNVRLIYSLHEQGLSQRKIIAELAKREIKSPMGKPTWSVHTIQRILTNEKYKGDVLFYKTFRDDYPSTRIIKNTGEHIKYLVSEHHEAIIKQTRI